VIVRDGLREIDHGNWTGLTASEIAERYGEEYAAWKWSPETFRPRSGENLWTVYRRATGFLPRVLDVKRTQSVVVVSHGVVNALLLCSVLGVSLGSVWDFPQPNGGCYALRFRRREVIDVEYLNHV